jgi:hypothetical protein
LRWRSSCSHPARLPAGRGNGKVKPWLIAPLPS